MIPSDKSRSVSNHMSRPFRKPSLIPVRPIRV
jgi:hypothetical protein